MPEAPIDEADATLQGCAALEFAWNSGKTPRWDDYLPASGRTCDIEQIFLLIQLDIEFRARAGLGGILEERYFQHPRLLEAEVQFTDDQRLELIRWEYQQRWKNGDRARREEYVAAFPELKVSLQTLRPRWNCPKCRRAAPIDDETAQSLSCGSCGSKFATTDIFHRRPSSNGTPDVPGYTILETLGQGGMGVVYKARQLGLNRTVALKMIRGGEASAEALARFRAEGEAVAKLQHPNIVQIFDVGEHNGLPYFSLEYVAGGSLDKHLAGQPQPPAVAARMVQTLAQAMQAAHARGLVHRDLKPANILLSGERRAENGEQKVEKLLSALDSSHSTLKITDFGLAKQLDADSGQTRTGAVMGTPSYMAPEQALGRTDIRAAADIYSLGAILYELLTGRPPFRGASLLETLEQVRTLDPVRPSQLQPRLPRDLETICLKCLDKEPSSRYATSQALADDLGRWLGGEPIKARRPWPGERFGKWVRRKPWVAAALSACVLAVAAGSVALVRHEQAQRSQRINAQNEARELAQVTNTRHGDLRFHYLANVAGSSFETEGRNGIVELAKAALEPYGLDHDTSLTRLEQQLALLTDTTQAELASDCCEILMTWAEVESSPTASQEITARAELLARTFTLSRRDWFRAARDDYRAGRLDLVHQACDDVLQQRPQDFWAHYLKGLCDLQTRLWGDARVKMSSAIALRPEFLWPRMQRGFASSEEGQTRRQNAEQARDLFASAGRDLDHVLARDPPHALRFLTLANRGVLRVRQQQWDKAIDDLDQAVQLEPQRFIAYLNLAHALEGANRWDEALTRFNAAIKLSPQPQLGTLLETRAQFHRKRLERARKDKDADAMKQHRQAAIDDLEAALDLAPPAARRLQDWFDLGVLYQDQGDLQRSLQALDEVAALEPDHRDVHQLRGEILLKLQRHQEAGQALDRHLQANPSPKANVCIARALIHLEHRQLTAAVDRLSQALRLEPNPRTQRLRGWTHLMLDAAHSALADFQTCLKQEPGDIDAVIGRGLAHVRLKKLTEALQDVEAAEKIGPHTARDHYNLACLYAQLAVRMREEQATPNPLLLTRISNYLDKATRRLDHTLQMTPLSQRTAFWRDRIAADPFLAPIRRSEGYLLLAAKYAGPNP